MKAYTIYAKWSARETAYMEDSLRKFRDERFLSVCELARMAEVSPSTVFEIERGGVEPQRRTLRKLAHALGVEPRELCDWIL